MFIDTHAHIFTEEFDGDTENIINRALEAGVTDIFMPNIDSERADAMVALDEKYDFCHAMMGLHPCSVGADFRKEIAVVENYFSERDFWAVGEIGIDFYWDTTYAEEQIFVFKKQIEMARELKIPVSIHSRNSLDLTIRIIEDMQDGNLSGVFHCFNGDLNQAKKIIDTGFYMGIGGVVTFKNAGVDKVVADVPLEHLVLETDSPYLSPVPYRGKRNEPSYVIHIAEKLAEIKNISLEDIGTITTKNAKNLFKLS